MKKQTAYMTSRFSGFLRISCVTALLLTLGACIPKDGDSGGGGGSVSAPAIKFLAVNDGVNGNELWKTDGTADGTVLVKDINATAKGSSNPSGFTKFNGVIYFQANDGVNGNELWKTDGTTAGTVLVKNINPATGADSSPDSITELNGALYFAAGDGVTGYELWKTDGTAEGTALVKDINTAAGAHSVHPGFTVLNGAIYFRGDDGVNGTELWKTDGTAAGTVLVKDIDTARPGANSFPDGFTVFNGALYFTANDEVHGQEPWKTDGTTAGTVMLKDINPIVGNSNPHSFTAFNGALYFSAGDGVLAGLWKTDGTDTGTVLVKNIIAFAGNYSSVPNVTELNGALYFVASEGLTGLELWKTDGTTDGTVLVKDINPTPGSGSSPSGLIKFNNALYFNARNGYVSEHNGMEGAELWKTDGTDAGTVLVKDINTAAGMSSNPAEFSVLNGVLYFKANDGISGTELWKTDGTNTQLLKDLCPGSCGIGGKGSPPSFTRAIALPKTGQTWCDGPSGYPSGCANNTQKGPDIPDQDGDLKVGVAWPNPRFSVDGTSQCITDNLTGLMWVRQDAVFQTWQQSLDYANNLDLCGFTDWRMPNRKDLRSLVNYGLSNVGVWLRNNGFTFQTESILWSSTSVAGSASDAWGFIVINGIVSPQAKFAGNYVLPVRAGK